MEDALSASEFFAVLRRHRRTLFAALFFVILTTIGLAYGLPAVYRSTGTILVEQQEIPLDIVRSTVTSYADERIQVISQRVMARSNLVGIIEEFDLVEDSANLDSVAIAVSDLRRSITMEMIDAQVNNERTGRVSNATIAFTVSYENQDPEVTRAIAGELVNLYLEQNQLERVESAAVTSRFLGGEVERSARVLEETEATLAYFKQENASSLPEMRDFHLLNIDRARRESTQLQADIRELEQNRALFEAELAQLPAVIGLLAVSPTGEPILSAEVTLQELQAEHLRLSSIYSPEHPDLIALRKQMQLYSGSGIASARDELGISLALTRAELDAMRQRYSEDHPDVVRLLRSVESLEQQLAASPLSEQAPIAEPNNPEYLQRQVRLRATRDEIVALSRRNSELQREIATYETELSQMPEVERQLMALTREYNLNNSRYNEVREQQVGAQLAETMESESNAERFTVINYPLLPTAPISPNRPAILVLGMVLALALSIGMVAIQNAVDGTVRGTRDIRALLEIPPIAIIPCVENSADRHHQLVVNIASGAVAAASIVLVIWIVQ